MTTMLQSGQALAARYYLLRRLGTGRSGEVWLARDAQLRRDVAVKVLSRAAATDPQATRRFVRGAELQREFAGPRVIECESIHSDSDVFAVFEAATRGDVSRLRGSDWPRVAATLVEVADGLAALHARGYVHRDLKPANVLLTEQGAKLTDFELAAGIGDRGAEPAGSPLSASPAQLAGDPPSVSDDVYSFGALAYELLSGYPPRHGRSGNDGDIAALPGRALVPEAVETLIRSCLAQDPRQRPASVAEVREVLAANLPQAESAAASAARPSVQLTPPGGAIEPIVPTWKPSAASGPSPEELRWQGFRRGLVVAALVLLIGAAGTVFFLLPDWVAQRRPQGPVAAQVPVPAPQEPQRAAEEKNLERLAEIKRKFEELRPKVAERLAKLEKQGAGVWGGEQFATGKGRFATAEAAFADRDYERAMSELTAAERNLEAVGKLAATRLREALEAAEAALVRGDAADATRQFQLALQIDPGNARATRGLKRAGVADQVRALVAEAGRLEGEGRTQPALDTYRRAAGLDPESREAREGIARITAKLSGDAFAAAITRGLEALGRRDYTAARSAFEAAGRVRPGAPEVRDGLAQIDRALGNEVISGHLASAQAAEREERWQEAVAGYRKALAVDPNLLAAQQGLERSEPRAQLDAELASYISRPERLFSADVRGAARAALERARSLPRPAPALDRQVARIAELVAAAETPVRVALTSDSQTQVTIYRVGNLGAFERREMELMPGRYTVVGTRAGFRDVRREVTLLPGATPGPIAIRCEEPI